MRVREFLGKKAKESKQDLLDKKWLLAHRLQLSFGALVLAGDQEISREDFLWVKSALILRKKGMPLQYITGQAEFFGRNFSVNRKVLIPRPETERLVELALERFGARENLHILDIGTGSGVIAITLKLERPRWSVFASDISSAALAVAKKNAKLLGAAIAFKKADLFAERLAKQRIDLLVANPPYLDFKKDRVSGEVRRHEPRLALEPGQKYKIAGINHRGAWHAQKILEQVASLSQKPICLFELSPAVSLFLAKKWSAHPSVKSMERLADLAGRKRFLLVAWKHG